MAILPDNIGQTTTSLKCGGVAIRKLAAHRYRHGKWTSTSHASSFSEPLVTSFKVLCWNVGYRYEEPYEHHWAKSFVKELKRRLGPSSSASAEGAKTAPCCVVLLQEVQRDALHALYSDDWIRQTMIAVPVPPSISDSSGSLGATVQNVTLVSRTIPVSQALHVSFFNSQMARHAVVVDLKFYAPADQQSPKNQQKQMSSRLRNVRIINVQLESFKNGGGARDDQTKFLLSELSNDHSFYGVLLGVDVKDVPADDAVISPNQDERTSRVVVQEPVSRGNETLTSKSLIVLRKRLGPSETPMEGVRVAKSRSGIIGNIHLT
ncbi:hypothetical protein SISNIDRAFT_270756 [Sistotremastrum niveocremeum HHB9708]|uniref:Endonuclease/exonuclease/phosphatase domain-containing protein n=2 Tax=Sistotremastraceae TaxID=3402574 RepID=A0A164NUM7_9AGAM|nr:hypothetical protein SISNIDRAFT_270756 [Sistotremastrum niveocremeum HHB9708]KZT40517.1 hypothetical protein SISSUDRAFT_484555 [Sistotremastrum suecicum HHB10207 ss-3]